MIKLIDILKTTGKLNEQEDAVDFDRTEFYQQYYKNVSPSDFVVEASGDTIIITIKQKQ